MAGETCLQPLGDGLVLKSVADERDAERVAAFDGVIHGEGVAAMTRQLLFHHPATRWEDFWFVEDERTGEVVSSLGLIPWTWRYGGVTLTAGEMGIVGTLEPYRRRGLIRAQVEAFQRRLQERGCDLSHIQGIPYFYRQFGYEYALPLEAEHRLELHQIPDAPAAGDGFTFRLATPADRPVLQQLYDEASQDLTIHTVRDEATWDYLLEHPAGTETEAETWLVEQRSRGSEEILTSPPHHLTTSPPHHLTTSSLIPHPSSLRGYVRISRHGFGPGLIVSEVSRLSHDAALAVLRRAKQWAVERGKPFLRLNLPAGVALTQAARGLGAVDLGTYAWQIHFPDRAAFLRKIGPVLEQCVAASPFAGLTQEVFLNLYVETLVLRFADGRLTEAARCSGTGGEGPFLHLPPLLLAPLALGYRSFDELRQAHHDVRANPPMRALVDVLFPKVASFLYTVY